MNSSEFNTFYNARVLEFRKLAWNDVRASFRTSIAETKAYARYLAETALENFATSGDNSKLNDVLDDLNGMGKDFIRKAAFLKWCIDHQPLKYDNNKLIKDRDTKIDKQEYDALLVEAMQIPFWEYAPEKEFSQFDAQEVILAIEGVIKRFSGKKLAPRTETGAKVLAMAQEQVSVLRKSIPVSELVAATPISAVVHKTEEPSQEMVAGDLGEQTLTEQKATAA